MLVKKENPVRNYSKGFSMYWSIYRSFKLSFSILPASGATVKFLSSLEKFILTKTVLVKLEY